MNCIQHLNHKILQKETAKDFCMFFHTFVNIHRIEVARLTHGVVNIHPIFSN